MESACVTDENTVKFVVADNQHLLDEICHFRYHVYVALMKRQQIYADHVRRTIFEPLDTTGVNCAAFISGRIVGAIRSNSFAEPASSYYQKIYRVNKFSEFDLSEMSFTTKLMVLPEFRKTSIPTRLIREYASLGYRAGIKLTFIDCNKPLIPMFERMGYFSYMGWAFHKEYGTVRPMFMATDTLRYQRYLKSILYKPASIVLVDNQYDGYSTVRRYAERPSCSITAKVADECFEFSSPALSRVRA